MTVMGEDTGTSLSGTGVSLKRTTPPWSTGPTTVRVAAIGDCGQGCRVRRGQDSGPRSIVPLPFAAGGIHDARSHSGGPYHRCAPPLADASDQEAVAAAMGWACRGNGFFYVIGHGVSEDLSHAFFAQDVETKLEIRMALAGKAWRGYSQVGDELTSGRPDVKEERLYFGLELSEEDPRVHAGLPLHGPNLFLVGIAGFGDTILQYMAALTDYGVLTILKQDDVGGLQVKVRSRWIDAPPVPNSFVCNISDTLDRLTRGLYRPTHHRVQNVSGRSRF
jgi:isopenicillin N synthase-like dioxygenase